MTKLLRFSDNRKTCWAGLKMDSGDPVWISIAQDGVMIKKSIFGIMGRKLYDEKNIHTAFMVADILHRKFRDDLTPQEIVDAALKTFTNAVLHCSSIEEVADVLNEAKNSVQKF